MPSCVFNAKLNFFRMIIFILGELKSLYLTGFNLITVVVSLNKTLKQV